MSLPLPITRSEAAARQLRAEIVSGALKPGTPIKDAETAARLGFSITPIREALAQLAVEGLVETDRNRTRRVARLTRKNALDLIDVMAVLACAGFEWGVTALTDDHIGRLRDELARFATAIGNGDDRACARAGVAFSRVVLAASGNDELLNHIELVVWRTLRLMALDPDTGGWEFWLSGYQETFACLERGDRAAAVTRYRQLYLDYRARLETRSYED